jgi:hypothetical protein
MSVARWLGVRLLPLFNFSERPVVIANGIVPCASRACRLTLKLSTYEMETVGANHTSLYDGVALSRASYGLKGTSGKLA